MTAEKRRQAIVETLKNSTVPCNASALAKTFGVSRQVIVADVALLRAAGMEIHATPRGYLMEDVQTGEFIYRLACCHTAEEMETELNIMVDNGCTVVDVIVEHPIYGQISGRLDLSSRYDVSQFVEKLSTQDAPPLSSLTGGVHLHTLICPDEDAYLRVRNELAKENLLFSE